MIALELLAVGDQLLDLLRITPLDPACLQDLLDRRERLIPQLHELPPGLRELLTQQDHRLQSALAALLKAMRRQMRYCAQPEPAHLNILVDACR